MKARVLFGSAALALAASVVALPASTVSAATVIKAQVSASGSGPRQNLSATASPSWQTNNTVWAIAPVNGNVFVGGSFTSVRPPGDPSGTGEVARTYLAEFSASTGALVSSFNPALEGQVTALAVSPDGSTLYVGGSFTHVNGSYRAHLAAFSTSTGALISTWAPPAGSPVLTIAPSPTGSDMYIGGNFTKLDGAARTYAGEVSSSTGALLPWAPDVNGSVTSITVAPNDSRVLVGGYFSKFNGAAQQAIVDVSPTTGSGNNLTSIEPNYKGCSATVKDIVIGSVTASAPAGIAYIASEGTGGGCFDGDWAASVSTGALVWQNDCLGATQSLVIINNWLYKGSHAHDCAYEPGGFPQEDNSGGNVLIYHLLDQALVHGTLGHWTPDTDMGNSSNGVVGGGLGPRVMATDGTSMFLGGDFTTVNNRPQQGFAIFRPTPDTAPGKPVAPTATSTGKGVNTVTLSAVSDPDDGTLSYAIYRSGTTAPIATVTGRSWPWALPVLHYQDTGLTPGSKYTYTVTASDGTLTSAMSPASDAATVASTSPALTYQQTVLKNKPSFLWRLDQRSGKTATDVSPRHFNGIYVAGITKGVPGPVHGSPATATKFNGRWGLVSSAHAVTGPQTFSIEAWFKTTTNEGGLLVGFGNKQTGASSKYDRHIYMMNDGQLVFGVYHAGLKDSAQTIETSNVYNDGQWHYVVATLGPSGMTLYVDGQLAGTNANTVAQHDAGYWRVGGDNLNGWNLDPWGHSSQGLTQPGSYYFRGDIANVAVYPAVLSAAHVAAHYADALDH